MVYLLSKALLFFLLCTASLFSFGKPADQSTRLRLKDHPQRALSERHFKKLSKAQELMGESDFGRALQILQQLEKYVQQQPFSLAQVLRVKGQVFIQEERYNEAIETLDQALNLGVLPRDASLKILLTLAQLKTMQQKYEQAESLLSDYIYNQIQEKAQVYVILAQVESKRRRFDSAIGAMEKAITLEPKPPEVWLQVLVGLYFEVKKLQKAEEALLSLIKLYPMRKRYWLQLASIYSLDSRYLDSAATLELAYKQGLIREESEYLQLVQSYLAAGVPHKAARHLGKALAEGQVSSSKNNILLLAECWQQARELGSAIKALENAVGSLQDPELLERLGNIYLAQENWDAAKNVLKKALAGSTLDDRPQIWLSLGIAQFNRNEYKKAVNSFTKASKSKVSAKQAKQWLAYLSNRQSSP